MMPPLLRLARSANVVLGVVLITVALIHLAIPSTLDERRGITYTIVIAGLAIGALLIIPHRRVSKSRFAPFLLAMSLLLPIGTVVGLAVTLWRTFMHGGDSITAVGATVIWLCFCTNAEHARRSFKVPGDDEKTA